MSILFSMYKAYECLSLKKSTDFSSFSSLLTYMSWRRRRSTQPESLVLDKGQKCGAWHTIVSSGRSYHVISGLCVAPNELLRAQLSSLGETFSLYTAYVDGRWLWLLRVSKNILLCMIIKKKQPCRWTINHTEARKLATSFQSWGFSLLDSFAVVFW